MRYYQIGHILRSRGQGIDREKQTRKSWERQNKHKYLPQNSDNLCYNWNLHCKYVVLKANCLIPFCHSFNYPLILSLLPFMEYKGKGPRRMFSGKRYLVIRPIMRLSETTLASWGFWRHAGAHRLFFWAFSFPVVLSTSLILLFVTSLINTLLVIRKRKHILKPYYFFTIDSVKS